MSVSEDKRDTVDYALKVDGENRVFLEAKIWKDELTKKHEEQLRDYCNDAEQSKPKLAALTNGRQWRLYLATDKSHLELRKFLEFDIITDSRKKVEQHIRKFLSYEKISKIKSPLQAAHYQHRKLAENTENLNKIIRAWNKAAHNRREQEKLLTLFAQSQDIAIDIDYFRKNLGPKTESLVNPLPEKPKKAKSQRPTGFTLDNGQRIPAKNWTDLVRKLCRFLYAHHPNSFSQGVLSIRQAWISPASDIRQGHELIADSGVAVSVHGSAKVLENRCRKIVASLGSYQTKALIIHRT